MDTFDRFIIYTDGGYNYETQTGVAASLILIENLVLGKIRESGPFQNPTVAEMNSVIIALTALPDNSRALVYNDCYFISYLVHKIQNKWDYKRYLKKREYLQLGDCFTRLKEQLKRLGHIEVRQLTRRHPLIRWCDGCHDDKIWNDIELESPLGGARLNLWFSNYSNITR